MRQRIASPLYAKNTSAEDVFRLAWECTCSNTIVTIVALYDKPQMLPLPEIYGKNLTFKRVCEQSFCGYYFIDISLVISSALALVIL